MNAPSLYSALPPQWTLESKTIKSIPQKPLARMAVKLYLLGFLAWDYADTCCNISATLRDKNTKKLCRAVRDLKRDYDRFRNRSMRDSSLAKEEELALMFEEICDRYLSRLNFGIGADKALSGLNKEYALLIKAVQMAMTILDTMKMYAAECDRWICRQGVAGHSIMADHFVRLSILLPEFAGDCYEAGKEARRLTAMALLNEIKAIEIVDE